MAEGGKLPVQHGDNARFRGVEHHVTQAVVPVDDARFVRVRHVLRQPRHELIHGLNILGF